MSTDERALASMKELAGACEEVANAAQRVVESLWDERRLSEEEYDGAYAAHEDALKRARRLNSVAPRDVTALAAQTRSLSDELRELADLEGALDAALGALTVVNAIANAVSDGAETAAALAAAEELLAKIKR
jgi:hypothetical protein